MGGLGVHTSKVGDRGACHSSSLLLVAKADRVSTERSLCGRRGDTVSTAESGAGKAGLGSSFIKMLLNCQGLVKGPTCSFLECYPRLSFVSGNPSFSWHFDCTHVADYSSHVWSPHQRAGFFGKGPSLCHLWFAQDVSWNNARHLICTHWTAVMLSLNQLPWEVWAFLSSQYKAQTTFHCTNINQTCAVYQTVFGE